MGTMEVRKGTRIGDAFKAAHDMAQQSGEIVHFRFNDLDHFVMPDESLEAAMERGERLIDWRWRATGHV